MRPCCQKRENREKPVRLTEDMSVSLCRVCGAKHWEVAADPGKMFGDGAEL